MDLINQDLKILLAQTNPDKLTAELGRAFVKKFEMAILNNALNQILN